MSNISVDILKSLQTDEIFQAKVPLMIYFI